MDITKIIEALGPEELKELFVKAFNCRNRKEQEEILKQIFDMLVPGYELVKRVEKPVEPEPKRKETRAKPVEVGGVEYKSIAQACRVHGLNLGTVHARVRKLGVTHSEAIEALIRDRERNRPPLPPNGIDVVKPIQMTIGGANV